MKIHRRVLPFIGTALLLLGLTACGNVRELPTEKVITLYNSNLEKTTKFDYLDSLYVKLGGLKANTLHTVEVLDPDNNLISKMTAMTDKDGVIPPSVLWYDVGMRRDNQKPDIGGSLSLKAFYVRVTGPGTDYKEPFYIVYSTSYAPADQPKPIVWAAATAGGGVENSFDETGTPDVTIVTGGTTTTTNTITAKTKVYVEARNISKSLVSANTASAVDIYIMHSKGAGNTWKNGEVLTNKFVVRRLNQPVTPDTNGTMKLSTASAVWDLNAGPQLTNPNEANNSYDVIVDVNQNGVFDIGTDTDSDGAIDHYVDGIDGQGVVGFIVANTPANDLFVTITDATGNKTDTINETGSQLFISINNMPATAAPVLHLYSSGTTSDIITAPALLVTAATVTNPWTDGHYLPYVASTKFIDTAIPASTPSTITNPAIQNYDLVVTGIGSADYTATIKVIHPPASVKTSSGTYVPTDDSTLFDETGTTTGKTKIHVYTSGVVFLQNQATVYIVPTRTAGWTSGTILANFTTSRKVTVSGGNLPATLIWDLNVGPKLINPTAANNMYDVIVDANNDGVYNTGDVASSLAFAVRDTAANNLPDVTYINIASGGVFTNERWNPTSQTYEWDWDYRDTFASNGLDTQYSWDWTSNYANYGYGIKAIWNPYVKPPDWAWGSDHWQLGGTNLVNQIYQGKYVDVYIVDATKARLVKDAQLGVGDFTEVAGGKKTIPVQTGCFNGSAQQLIWIPNFTVGKYYVIVDVNRDGLLTEGVDIVDAVTKDGRTIKDDPNIVGFTVN